MPAATKLYKVFNENVSEGNSFLAKFFLGVELSCFKKQFLKPKCVATDVDWNNVTYNF